MHHADEPTDPPGKPVTDRLLGTDPTTVTGGDAMRVLARAAGRAAVPVAALLVVGALVLGGVAAAVTAGITAAVLIGLHVGSGVATARFSRGRPLAMPGITMAALVLRLAVYGVAVVLLADVTAVHVAALATTVLVLTAVLLAVETRLVLRYSRYWWDTTTTTPETDATAPVDGDPAAAARPIERTHT